MRRRAVLALVIGLVAVPITSVPLAVPAVAASAPEGSRWSIQPSPDPPGSAGSALSAVSCATDGTCTAVGWYSPGAGFLPLAERWDGSTWSIETTRSPPGAESLLTGISCPGPQRCVAVGYSVSTKVRPLVEAWDGTSWTIASTPRPGRAWWFELIAVSCAGISDCTAVGSSIGPGIDAQERPLAERWNGTSWTIEHTPNPHAENGSGLTGVACDPGGTCEAVGDYVYADVEESIFAAGWNGSKWSLQQQPDPGGNFVTVDDGVSCADPTACISVGSWNDLDGRIRGLAESWDGVGWTQQTARDPKGSAVSELAGVACAGPTACVAVGDWSTSFNDSPSSTLAERWNGTGWRIQSTPNPKGATDSSLDGVACSPEGACVAVGSSYDGTITTTLVEVSTP